MESALEASDDATPAAESDEAAASAIVRGTPKRGGAMLEESARLRHGAELDEDEEVAARVESEEDYAPEEAAVKERDPEPEVAEAPKNLKRLDALDEDEDEGATNETRDDASQET